MAVLLSQGVAKASEVPPSPGWEFSVTPYLWMAGLGGKATDRHSRSATFNQSFGDVLSHLNAAVMMLGNVRYGRWVGLADFDYANLSAKSDALRPILGESGLSATSYIGTVAGGYRFISTESGVMDGLAGVRIVSLDSRTNFSGGLLPSVTLRSSGTWVTPVLALRGMAALGSGFYVNGYADAGIGNWDDLTWQIYGGLGYDFTPQLTANFGYRYLAIQHRPDNLTLNIDEQGPLLGFGYRF